MQLHQKGTAKSVLVIKPARMWATIALPIAFFILVPSCGKPKSTTDAGNYRNTRTLQPDDAKKYKAQGISYCESKDWHRAIRELSNALLLAPEDWSAYEWRGVAYLSTGAFEGAVSDLSRLIRNNPTNTIALWNRASAYARLREFRRAIEDVSNYLQLNPEDAVARAFRGQYHAQNHEYEQAAQDYLEAIRLNPNTEQAYNGLGWLRATCPIAALRDGREAIKAVTKSGELTKWGEWRSVNNLAAAYAEAGDFQAAVDYQKRAMTMPGVADSDLAYMEYRLSLYEHNQAYRETEKE